MFGGDEGFSSEIRQNMRTGLHGTRVFSACLYLCGAAVHEEFDAGDVAAVVGGQEDDCFGYLVGGPESSHGNDVADAGEALLSDFAGTKEFLQSLGVDGAGAYGVDANAASFEVCG